MEQLLPWPQLLKPILKRYPKPGQGRRPIPAEGFVRIYCLHQGYGLSDPAMEDRLYDREALRRFAQVALAPMPDETTLGQLRHCLEAHELTAALLRLTTQYLAERAVLVQTGTIVEATILAASGSTKNQAQARDPEMASTKKGRNWSVGLKAPIGRDPQGRVHRVAVPDTSVHASPVLADGYHGAEQVIYGEKAYANAADQRAGETWPGRRKQTGRDRSAGGQSGLNLVESPHPILPDPAHVAHPNEYFKKTGLNQRFLC